MKLRIKNRSASPTCSQSSMMTPLCYPFDPCKSIENPFGIAVLGMPFIGSMRPDGPALTEGRLSGSSQCPPPHRSKI